MIPAFAKQFDRQAHTYDQSSTIQVELVERLTHSLWKHVETPLQDILDVGCGTGHLSVHLAKRNPSTLHLLDLSTEMLSMAQKRVSTFVTTKLHQGNAEDQNWDTNSFDLIASSAALQWFQNPHAFFEKAFQWLKPQGWFAIATFGPATLQELHQNYLVATGRPLPTGTQMLSTEWLITSASDCGFDIVDSGSHLSKTFHTSPKAMLLELKNMGVTSANPHPLSKTEWKKLQHLLESQRTEHGIIPLTWELTWVVARKR